MFSLSPTNPIAQFFLDLYEVVLANYEFIVVGVEG